MSKDVFRILVAEDDVSLGDLLVKYLQKEGFDPELFRDGASAWKAFQSDGYDLCLLDVMMPETDGFSLLKKIRKKDKKIPVILLTARSLKEDKINGYELGSDDYITKPFDEEELLWKIKVFARRTTPKAAVADAAPLVIGKYRFDSSSQLLFIGNESKRMTEKESEVLAFLYRNRNQVIRREHMLKELWGENDYFLGRSLDVFITKIRKYLKEDERISIENVFRVGFIFTVPAEENVHP